MTQRGVRALDDDYLGAYPIRQTYYRGQVLVEFLVTVRGLSSVQIMDDDLTHEYAWNELRDWYRAH